MKAVDKLPLDQPTTTKDLRYLHEPYLVHHANYLYEAGLLQGDLNPVQAALLRSYMYRYRKNESQQMQDALQNIFEQQLMIHKYEAYKSYKESQRVSQSIDPDEANVEWRTPTSVEEMHQVAKEFEELMSQDLEVEESDDDDGDWLTLAEIKDEIPD